MSSSKLSAFVAHIFFLCVYALGQEMDGAVERVVQSLLEDSLPAKLKDLPRDMAMPPPPKPGE